MTYSGTDAVPVLKTILCQGRVHEIRLHDIADSYGMSLTVLYNKVLPAVYIVFLKLALKPLIYLALSLSGLNYLEPVTARPLRILACKNLNSVAVLNDIIDIHKLSVNSGSNHLISDSRMDAVGKIDRRRSRRKILHISRRSEAVNAVGKEVQIRLYDIKELGIILHVLLPLKNLTEPGILRVLAGLSVNAVLIFLIFPVSSDTVFSCTVHIVGSYLNLEGLSLRPYKGRVKALVHVALRHGDIILETPRNRGVHLMNYAKRRVAVLHSIHNYADSKEVVYLIECLVLIHHFLVNGKIVLYTPADSGVNARFLYVLTDLFLYIFNEILSFLSLQGNLLIEHLVHIRLKILKGEIVKLDLNLADTEALGKRRVNIHGLAGFLYLLLGRLVLHGSHIVKSVGKLNKYNPDVLRHGKEHFPQVFSLNVNLVLGIF